ncbi:hypothetical protein AVEN_2846-1 [Araneus ventricosus]|uniref:Uncharacterized protein n=1 Tax=Araneus ventricosus TaxID=182803 RepID=A0A4Y2DWB9_ARAVE|nr:hypothetical protein AVEN_2846-1 [Araneus ventricosus]
MAHSVRRPYFYVSPGKEPSPADRYLLLLQDLSDEVKAYDFNNASGIDKEHIEENYHSNSENEAKDLQDTDDLLDDDSDANESNYFMKIIYKTKTVKGKNIKKVSEIQK